jgi:epoxyqueuosine reductase
MQELLILLPYRQFLSTRRKSGSVQAAAFFNRVWRSIKKGFYWFTHGGRENIPCRFFCIAPPERKERVSLSIEDSFARSGAASWGSCAFFDLQLEERQREKALESCPNAQGVFVAAYPYFAGTQEGNLSLYARGEDYHAVLLRRLTQVAEELQEQYPDNHFVPAADNSPLDERQCARLAGLGIIGRHGLVIVEPYGSWVFLGTILTDLPLRSAPTPAPDCMGCGACVCACPGGALREQPFCEEKCLSALTQKKGTLPPEEEALVKAHPLIWGCDTCQLVCPYNQKVVQSPLPDLTGQGEVPYLATLTREDMEGLTNKTFRGKYGQRAFAWRGPAVLRRNLEWNQEQVPLKGQNRGK